MDGVICFHQLAQDIQRFIFQKLIPGCHRFLVTARSDICPPFIEEGFTILGMQGYTEEYQRNLLRDELDGEAAVFMDHLLDHAQASTLQDECYASLDPADTVDIESIKAFDKLKLKSGAYDNSCRQVTLSSLASNRTGVGSRAPAFAEEVLQVAAQAKDVLTKRLAFLAHYLKMPFLPPKSGTAPLPATGCIILDAVPSKAVFEKRAEKFQLDVDQGRRSGPAAAWVHDLVSASVVCPNAASVIKAFEMLNNSLSLCTTIKVKNYFVKLDPLHRRRIEMSLKLEMGKLTHVATVKVYFKGGYEHRVSMRAFNYFETLAQLHRSSSRSVAEHAEQQQQQQTLPPATAAGAGRRDSLMVKIERSKRLRDMIDRWSVFSKFPVYMSMFIVVVKTVVERIVSGVVGFEALPANTADLYAQAIDGIIKRRLEKGPDTDERPHVSTVRQALSVIAFANSFTKDAEGSVGSKKEFHLRDLTDSLLDAPPRFHDAIQWCLHNNADDEYRPVENHP